MTIVNLFYTCILQQRNRGFAEAVEKSRQFYNLTLSDEEDQGRRGVLTHIIEEGKISNLSGALYGCLLAYLKEGVSLCGYFR